MSETPIPLKPRALMLDTCIWVNSQIGTNRGHEAARKLIVAARKRGMQLGIAPHSLSTVFYVVCRHLGRFKAKDDSVSPECAAAAVKETAWGVVNSIMDYAIVIGADGSDARIAALHKSVHDDFEDDLVLAAARRMRADLIVSDDLGFVKHSPLPIMTADDALRWIMASE